MNSGKNEYAKVGSYVYVVTYGHNHIRGTKVFATKEKAEGFILGWTWEGEGRYAEMSTRVIE